MSSAASSSDTWTVQPRTAFLAALGISIAVGCIAHFVLFPGYQTNDDVGIRLILEGRFVVGAAPSGYAYFTNLAFGQALATLYRQFPAVHWYDIAEHGAVLLATLATLYCVVRHMRSLADAAFIVLIAAVSLATFHTIQFTIVAMLCTIVGASTVLFAQRFGLTATEARALTLAGTLLIVLGALFRLEAGLLGLLVVAIVAATNLAHPLVASLHRPSLLLVPLAGLAVAACAWTFHAITLAESPGWQEFFSFNILRARLGELFLSRLDRATLAHAYAAAGWSIAEHDLLTSWLFIDPQFFNAANLERILAHLPALPEAELLRTGTVLRTYLTGLPFFPLALAGIVLSTGGKRPFLAVLLSFLVLVAGIAFLSTLLKPLEYRLLWPLASGYLVALWLLVVVHSPRPSAPIVPLMAAASHMAAASLIATMVWQTSGQRAAWSRNAQTDLAKLALPTDKVAVLVGSAFPYEAIERPFAPPVLQRALNTIPLGALALAPVIAPLVKERARPDLATWMCSDAAVLIVDPGVIPILEAYYPRRRGYSVSFERIFTGSIFSAYRCRPTPGHQTR